MGSNNNFIYKRLVLCKDATKCLAKNSSNKSVEKTTEFDSHDLLLATKSSTQVVLSQAGKKWGVKGGIFSVFLQNIRAFPI